MCHRQKFYPKTFICRCGRCRLMLFLPFVCPSRGDAIFFRGVTPGSSTDICHRCFSSLTFSSPSSLTPKQKKRKEVVNIVVFVVGHPSSSSSSLSSNLHVGPCLDFLTFLLFFHSLSLWCDLVGCEFSGCPLTFACFSTRMFPAVFFFSRFFSFSLFFDIGCKKSKEPRWSDWQIQTVVHLLVLLLLFLQLSVNR